MNENGDKDSVQMEESMEQSKKSEIDDNNEADVGKDNILDMSSFEVDQSLVAYEKDLESKFETKNVLSVFFFLELKQIIVR